MFWGFRNGEEPAQCTLWRRGRKQLANKHLVTSYRTIAFYHRTTEFQNGALGVLWSLSFPTSANNVCGCSVRKCDYTGHSILIKNKYVIQNCVMVAVWCHPGLRFLLLAFHAFVCFLHPHAVTSCSQCSHCASASLLYSKQNDGKGPEQKAPAYQRVLPPCTESCAAQSEPCHVITPNCKGSWKI